MDSKHNKAVGVVGVFDGVHRGHMGLLSHVRAEARKRGARAIAFTFDQHPLEVIRPEAAPKWVTLPSHRNNLLSDSGMVHQVVEFPFDDNMRRLTAAQFAAMLSRDYGVEHLVMGHDHTFGSDRLSTLDDYARACAQSGVTVSRAPRFQLTDHPGMPVSSTSVRKAVAASDFPLAADLLGRSYEFSGTVVCGRRDGRKLGFPTANIDVDPRQLLPPEGVYAAWVRDNDGNRLPAMLNIGRCPTLTDGTRTTAEAHILAPVADLYGRTLTVSPVAWLRGEQRFDSVEKLIAQLSVDRANALKALGL